MAQKKKLIEFLIELATTKSMQKKFKDGGAQWKQLVESQLSEEDATLVLSNDTAGIEAKVNEQKTSAHTVWTSATVWL